MAEIRDSLKALAERSAEAKQEGKRGSPAVAKEADGLDSAIRTAIGATPAHRAPEPASGESVDEELIQRVKDARKLEAV